jgi:hypothetical protein
VTRRNRVDPWGDLHAVDARGLFTGNRGSLVDESGAVVRHHRSSTLWITCLTEFRGHRQPLADPHRWTPIFFLDEAVALAAGHRPCAYCRRADYEAYRSALAGRDPRPSALELDRRLAGERLRRGRGLSRAADRPLWQASAESLPDGTVVLDDGRQPCLLVAGTLRWFTFDGWTAVTAPPPIVDVLTPPTSVAALSGGYRVLLHPSVWRRP